MPVNNQEANNAEWMQRLSAIAKASQNTSIKGVTDLTRTIRGAEADGKALLVGLTENIDKPILKSLAKDMLGVLGSFYVDEDALCCLIKNLLMMTGGAVTFEEYREAIDKLKRERGFENTNYDEVRLELKETTLVNKEHI